MGKSRNPFQGGMGFFTIARLSLPRGGTYTSQSLSGWDGVFHLNAEVAVWGESEVSQSLSGWDGVFHTPVGGREGARPYRVAIPFRVGWGFSLRRIVSAVQSISQCSRNPFQGGMGFFTHQQCWASLWNS